jgi:hypothetical protein
MLHICYGEKDMKLATSAYSPTELEHLIDEAIRSNAEWLHVDGGTFVDMRIHLASTSLVVLRVFVEANQPREGNT